MKSEIINSMKWRLFIIKLSCKWILKMGIGDWVWYKGKKYQIYNGVYLGMWRLGKLQNDHDGWVPRNECKKVLTLSNLIGSFKSGYWFYMTSWYDIWKNQGIQPWMLGCNIWGED